MIPLRTALRLPERPVLAAVGAGGKTTLLFSLAREYPSAWVTTTTHLGSAQPSLGDRHLAGFDGEAARAVAGGVTVWTGPQDPDTGRWLRLPEEEIEHLRIASEETGIPLLIEADGSRLRPLKAPAAHEPAIPAWSEQVVVVAGLQGVGQPLTEAWVHRPERFAALGGGVMGQSITPAGLAAVLAHVEGGQKGIPTGASKAVLLNNSGASHSHYGTLNEWEPLLPAYDRVIIADLHGGAPSVQRVLEPHAGIVLAAGGAARMGGRAKVLLEWEGEPLVRRAARTALAAGLCPVIVVAGEHAAAVEPALAGLAVTLKHNPGWRTGQSSSVISGLSALPANTGAAVFLLADQPHVPPALVRSLVDRHQTTLAPVIAPRVHGQRSNPVLFDRTTFPALLALRGDAGGRAVFDRYPPAYLDWEDERLLLDLDTPEDIEGTRSQTEDMQ